MTIVFKYLETVDLYQSKNGRTQIVRVYVINNEIVFMFGERLDSPADIKAIREANKGFRIVCDDCDPCILRLSPSIS